jgi:hypothetical protein
MKRGRKTKLTPELVRQICDLLRDGISSWDATVFATSKRSKLLSKSVLDKSARAPTKLTAGDITR